jgi:hypothetical protein
MKSLFNLNLVVKRNVEVESKYAKLKHRFQVDGKSLLEHAGKPLYPESPNYDIGVPSVIRAYTPTQADFCYMNKSWQEFSFGLIKRHIQDVRPLWPQKDIDTIGRKMFYSMYRDNAFQSNKRGTWTRRDWINQTNMDQEDIGLQPIFTGGNIVTLVGEKIYKGGTYYYPVHCFDGNKPPPDIDHAWDNRLEYGIMWATIETRIRTENNHREIRPFSFSGIDRVPFFVIVRDANVCYLNVDRFIFVSEEEARNNDPYATQ